MNKKKKVITAFLLVILNLTAISENTGFESLAGSVQTFWMDSNGLPSNRILDIVQDEIGYIWLASYECLTRFDGNSFTQFSKKEHNFTGVGPRVLCKGIDNSLWIGTNSTGLYNYKNHKFIEYKLQDGLPNLSIRAITYDNKKDLWVGTSNGIAKFNHNKFITIKNTNKDVGIISFLLPVNNSILVGSNLSGLHTIKNNVMKKYDKIPELNDIAFSAAFLDFDGSIWLGTSFGKIFKIKNDKIIQIYEFKAIKGININKFLRGKNGYMYIATDNGIIKLHKTNQKDYDEHILKEKIISSLCQDYEGNLWVGMEYNGIGKFTKGKFLDLTQASALPAEAINSVMEDSDKNIWIANDGGIICLMAANLSKKRKKIIEDLLNKLKGIRVRHIREEKNGNLVFATYSAYGLLTLSKVGNIKTLSKADGLPSNKVRFSFKDKNNFLWIGTGAGLAICYKNKIITLDQDNGLENSFILSGIQSSDGNIWLGTDGGGAAKINTNNLLSYFNDNSLSLKELKAKIIVKKNYKKGNGLNGNIVLKIVEDKAKNLWFCTGEGLTLFKNNKFYSANNSLGFERTATFNILSDNSGNLWIINPKELILVRGDSFVDAIISGKPAREINRYNRLDGLPGQLAANAWGYISTTNKLYIPTLKGVSVCDPNYDVSNKFPPPVVIEGFMLDDQFNYVSKDIFSIPAKIKRIMFKFTALSFTIPQRVYFEYKLEGYDTGWKSCGTSRTISYTNLYPGKYTFKIRATNNDGIINENGCKISFYKKPFFYQTIWFFVLLTTLIIFSIAMGVRLRLKKLKLHAEELDRTVKEKTHQLAIEKEKVDSLLKNILPLPVIDELIKTGKSQPKKYRNASVLFADLVNFTEWASNNTPEIVISELNKMFTHFDTIMDKFGCERIKTLGDGYMACCGLRHQPDHALRLVNAGIEMLSTIKDINFKCNQNFKIKIGIASGKITAGIVGVHKYIFDVFGDVVNTAFRLEASGVPMSCTISEKTAELLGKKYILYKRPKREIKGKGLLTSYYILYKENINRIVYEDIAKKYKKIIKLFRDKKYKKCKSEILNINTTLLEPEMLYKIMEIENEIMGKT